MKKLLAVLFALITCAAMLSAGALAEEKLELGSGSVEISTDGTYSISNVTTSYTVTVNGGVTATLTLNNVKITASSGAAITVEAGAELTLVLEGKNSLTGADNFAGISVAAAFDNNGDFAPDASAKLVIQGTGSLTANGGNDPLEVHKVVIWTHGDFLTVHVVGAVVCAYVAKNIDVIAADGFLDHALAFAVTEAGAMHLDQKILPL